MSDLVEIDDVDLIDGVERNRKNPRTFSIPTLQERTGIEPGTYVKVGVEKRGGNGERFWVKVSGMRGEEYEGIIDNDLVYTEQHGLEYRDVILFGPEHVLGLL